MKIPQVYPFIDIGINRSADASMSNFLYGLVVSSHICMSNLWDLLVLISKFSVRLPNHRPCPNSKIITSM